MRRLLRYIAVCLIVIIGLFCFIFLRIYWTSLQSTEESANAIAVLGAAQYDGKPSPIFKARLDHALELYNNGRASFIITTGGNRGDDTDTEGSVGKKYLIDKKVSAEAILVDDKSSTTKQNIARITEIAHEHAFENIILVSDPFHMYRSLLIAKDMNLHAVASPTTTSPLANNFTLTTYYMMREVILVVAHLFFDL